MSGRVCPWWLGYALICPVRRLFQNPTKILAAYIRPGMAVLEIGPGMGFFTLPMARLAGPSGRIIAVDIQPKMLAVLSRRAHRAGLAESVETRLATADSLGLDDLERRIDFVLAFAVVHEMPSAASLFAQAARVLKPECNLLLAEPAGHLKPGQFEAELASAAQAGFRVTAEPAIPHSRNALLTV